MITHLHLKNGAAAGEPSLAVDTGSSITIFVGPNNAGKSQALREIAAFCNTGQINSSFMILDKLVFSAQDRSTVTRQLEEFKANPGLGENIPLGQRIIKAGMSRFHIVEDEYIQAMMRPNDHQRYSNLFAQWHLSHFLLNLDGPSRISLVNPQNRGDLKNPQSSLARLLTNNAKREKLRKVIYDGIGQYFAIDISEGDHLKIRFGDTVPPDERSVNDATLDYMRAARSTDVVSDGVKAYTGIIFQLYAGDPKVVIIDEPEAFLHPALAQKLGKEIAKAAVNEGKNVFVSTHSPQFAMGAILSGAKVNIIRLTYEGGIGSARLLPSADLTKLMNDPLLRSVGVITGLFYNYVIVGEADADRAFYQEINERLLASDDPRGISNALFLNADNKQTIPRIIAPLRRLGIPVAGIADIDILKEGGKEWTRQLTSCSIPVSEHHPLGMRRINTLDALKIESADFKTAGGIGLLKGENFEAANNLLDELARYGLFIIRNGEVEDWLSTLHIARTKNSWLRNIFEKMGSDPAAPEYVRPAIGDVWDFIGQIKTWVTNPRRQGIPLPAAPISTQI